MKRFKKTYAEKKTLLKLALNICEDMSESNKCASEVNECESGVIKAFKWYLYKRERDGREYSRLSSNGILSVGSALHRRMWGTWSHRNLMKVRLRYRIVRNVCWAVKKVLTWVEMMHDKSEVVEMTSKSSFLPEEPEKRNLKDYCRGDRPSSIYLYINK